jgi:hypothetical protein
MNDILFSLNWIKPIGGFLSFISYYVGRMLRNKFFESGSEPFSVRIVTHV